MYKNLAAMPMAACSTDSASASLPRSKVRTP